MNLQELKTLGVRDLSVSNGQAIAVNPYPKIYSSYMPDKYSRYWQFEQRNLPPLPCAESVKEGTYPIGVFSEQWQYRHEPKCDWLNSNVMDDVDTFEQYQKDNFNIETRTVLVLSEPVAETEYDPNGSVHNPDNPELVEVAEKPEEESPKKSIYRCECGGFIFNNDHCALCGKKKDTEDSLEQLVEDFGNILFPSPPEAEPVESAIDFLASKQIASEKYAKWIGSFYESQKLDLVDLLEEYASLRVAQALKK